MSGKEIIDRAQTELKTALAGIDTRRAGYRRPLYVVKRVSSRIRRGLPDPRRTVGRFLVRRVLSSIAAGDNTAAHPLHLAACCLHFRAAASHSRKRGRTAISAYQKPIVIGIRAGHRSRALSG
jgi:hypothetical protein